jgi:arylformamidase
MGHSAGAQLAALEATDERFLADYGYDLDILNGVILLDGAGYDLALRMDLDEVITLNMYQNAFGTDPLIWEEASAINYVEEGKHIPPFLIFYVAKREISRVISTELASALENSDVEVQLLLAYSKNHGSLNTEIGLTDDEPTRIITAFLENYP